jgi:hypothetical protein
MSTGLSKAILSPDGRFEVSMEEFWDRSSPTITTRVLDRQLGEQIFSCGGAPAAEFTSEGMLVIHYSGYEPHGILIDPIGRSFRTHESEPWTPLTAWQLVEAAYSRGWSDALRFRQNESEDGEAWVEAALVAGSLGVLLLLLRFGSSLSEEVRIVLLIVCAVATFFFAWLWLSAVRYSCRKRSPGLPQWRVRDG